MTGQERAEWRIIQRESELHFPCFPSDVMAWAKSQLLEISQELEWECNDETIEQLARDAVERSAAGSSGPPQPPGNGPVPRRKHLERIVQILLESDPNIAVDRMPGTKKDLHELYQALSGNDIIAKDTFEGVIKGWIKFKPGARSSDYYRKRLERTRQRLG